MNDSPLFSLIKEDRPKPLNFSELESSFFADIAQAQDIALVDRLIEGMNETLKPHQLSEDEKAVVKKMRQRAYDRKRVLTKVIRVVPEEVVAAPLELPKIQEEAPKIAAKAPRPKKAISEPSIKESATEIVKVDGRSHIKEYLLLGASTCFIAGLVLMQTIPLYKSSGFNDSVMSAIGALVIMVSYPLYHAFSKSWFSLGLCVLACGYEIAFVYSGTHENERTVILEEVANNPTLRWLDAKVEKARLSYEEAKVRYDDPSQKVYQNGWFRKTALDPRWDDLTKAQNERLEAEHELKDGSRASWFTSHLKVIYRLGLVVMCMLLVHRLAVLYRHGTQKT